MKTALVLLVLALQLVLELSALTLINKPSAILYTSPEKESFIEDILRYGAHVTLLQEQEGFAQVSHQQRGLAEACPPASTGWLHKTDLLEVSKDPHLLATAFVGYRGAYLFKEADTKRGPFLTLPFETPLEVAEELPETCRRWIIVRLQDGQKAYVQRSQMVFEKRVLNMAEMVAFSQQFIGLKYLFGGTTSFGYDCSGFTQMLYRQMGVIIPRNSYQQAVDPRFQEVQEAQAGDLVFFYNAQGSVVHVGMMINSTEFIHSFPKRESWICITRLDEKTLHDSSLYSYCEVRRLST
ncbi:MAG: C40 family peptidase [Chlamydiota bacterium]